LAGYSIAAFTPPDAGVSGDEEVSSIVFTNGWELACGPTNTLVFIAP
jgi:hypothetical protein